MRANKGFTLIELVIGMVVLAIAMMIMNTMLISQSKDALEPLYRLRASQLGQSILQSILSRSYDENSDHNGGYYRCGEVWGDSSLWYDGTSWQTSGTATAIACSTPTPSASSTAPVYGVDSDESEGDHQNYNDVDDFITDGFESAVNYGDVLGDNLPTQYNNYAIKIEVAEDTTTVSTITMKRIDVTIQTPSDEEIVFSALKGNY